MKKRALIIIFLGILCASYAENVKKSVDNLRLDNNEDNGDTDDSKDVAMEIPDIEPQKKTQLCSARKSHHHMHPITNAIDRQFPFMASCLSLSEEHLCSGTLISNGMVLTAASCIAKQINAIIINTVISNLGYPNAERVSVVKSEKFPSYNGEESLYNVGIVYTWKHNASIASKLRISNYTSAQHLTDIEVLGFGLNEQTGKEKILQYIGVEHRYQDQPGNTLHTYIDCVETKEPTCFTDYGGPALYGNELVGIVTEGSHDCIQEMTANYAINKEIATILPSYSFKDWLEEKIKVHEENSAETIPIYPQKLVTNTNTTTPVAGTGNDLAASSFTLMFNCLFSLYIH